MRSYTKKIYDTKYLSPIILKMKQVVVLLLFNFLFFFAISQNNKPIYVSAWVKAPPKEDFVKPLMFIDFWATWCGPCISSMPYTESLSDKFKNNVLFLYISEEPTGKIEAFMKKRDKHFFSASDSTGNNTLNYKVIALPHSMLIDNEGNILWKGKPNEMTKKLLSKFVRLYKYEEGNINRIINVKPSNTKIIWNTFYTNSNSAKFLEVENVINEFTEKNNKFYISGDIKYFFSIINGIHISQIKTEFKSEKKYIFSANANDLEDFKNILKKFLKKECKISAYKEKIKQKVFILKDTTDENFFNENMYNFEKGDNTFLADDMSIMIDNATIEEMTSILSDFSKYTFIYKGKNKTIYDWNIHYKFNKFTIEQLRDELGFIVNEEEQKFVFYTLSSQE